MTTGVIRRTGRQLAGGFRATGLAALVLALPAALTAQAVCGTPGRDGPGGVLAGVVNTYFPGTTANLAGGATSITLGAATGAGIGITPGDLLLVIQMQDADINRTNTANYGANDGTGAGATALNATGRYEYVTALSTVGVGGGVVTIRGAGAGNGLVNSYRNANATGTAGQRRYQVIRVPQYSSATFSSALTARYWNGTSGGVLAVDVAGQLTLGGTVSLDGRGFRGGSGRGLSGGPAGSNTDYRNLSTRNFHGIKGEGIAGTPRYVLDAATGTEVNTGAEGYPSGATARGAPGNAGGGGTDGNTPANDQNSGGGGGGNAGAGGQGGNTWSSNLAVGGRGGAAFPGAAGLLVMGGGGGAGSRNNSSGVASHGGAGGGIVMIRAGTVTGTGTITASGLNGNTPANDGGGGGGAGGSVLVFAASGDLSGLTVLARGGNGGNADVGGAAHGPGGGGGGGLIVLSAAAATDVSGGQQGYTVTPGNFYGATAGAAGAVVTGLAAGGMPGTSPGALCVPALTVTKTTSTPTVGNMPTGTTATYTIVVTNAANRDTARTLTISDPLPAGFTFASASPPVLGGGASRPSATDPALGDAVPVWGTFAIPGGGSVTLTFVADIAAGVGGTFQNPATATYLDPRRITVNGTTTADYDPASSTGEDVTVLVLGVTVTPDGVDTLRRLPSNGTGYVYQFTVTNATIAADHDLLAVPGAALVVDSVRGAGFTFGARSDSARVSLAASASVPVSVWFQVANVTSGTLDSLVLHARAVASPAVRDSGWLFVRVVKPAIATVKSVAPLGVRAPGTELTYTLGVTNTGSEAAAGVVTVDSLPAEVEFKLGTVSATLPPGLTALVEYSVDGIDWTYTPLSGGCGAAAGYDRCVSRVRWTFQQPLGAVAPDNAASLQFVARIR
jgi:uncharacterized repeat protein (TIGR01451 family)